MLFLIVYMIVVWVLIMLWSFDTVINGKHDYFNFSHWFTIGFFTIFQLILGAFYIIGIDHTLQSVRWVAFIFIDVLLIEIFIKSIIRKDISIFVRIGLYFLIILDNTVLNDLFLVLLAVNLAYLSGISSCFRIRLFFTPAFILYAFANAAPSVFGATTIESLLIGAVYSTFVAIGVYSIYSKECKYKRFCIGNKCEYEKKF